MSGKKRVVWGVLTVVVLAMLLCWPFGDKSESQTASIRSNANESRIWKKLCVPMMPGAKMKSVNGSNLEDGIEFEFEINESPEDVNGYYEDQFGDRGLDSDASEFEDGSFMNDFAGGDFGVSMDIQNNPNGGGSTVRVYVERERQQVNTRNSSIQLD